MKGRKTVYAYCIYPYQFTVDEDNRWEIMHMHRKLVFDGLAQHFFGLGMSMGMKMGETQEPSAKWFEWFTENEKRLFTGFWKDKTDWRM